MTGGSDEVECIEEAARLLPWYVTGRLDEDDKVRVARHLEQCAVCRDDLDRGRQVHALVQRRGPLEYAPQAGLARTLARIDELERERPAPTTPSTTPATASRPSGTTRWLVAAVVVQAVGLGFLLVSQSHGTAVQSVASNYRTLADSTPVATLPVVRIVFAATMTVGDLRTLLAREGLTIVAGPSAAGTYAVAPSSPAARYDEAATLAALRADPGVLFAEPIAHGTAEGR